MSTLESNPTCSLAPATDTKIGLLAGWGRYPILVAQALARQGRTVYCIGVEGHADPRLADMCDHFMWAGLGKLGAMLRYFRRHGVSQATMAGKIHKHLLFQRGAWWKHLPDLRTLRCFYPHFIATKRDRKDDTLLLAVVDEFASEQIMFAPATDFAPELLVKEGLLTRRAPTARERKDIEFGWTLAKEMGRLDIGQSVVVKGQAAIAIEAIEGTDLCIERAGKLCTAGGFTVVKVAKPQQDMRFDVPTIGMGTMETMLAAGGACLAIESGRTIIIDEDEVIRFANHHGISIISMPDSAMARCAA